MPRGDTIRVGCCGWPVARRRYGSIFDFLKAPQLITHDPRSPTYRKLGIELSDAQKRRYGSFRPTSDVHAAWTQTLALARTLRSTFVLFQCPASFTPSAQHIRHMITFFETIERDGLHLAWEPRGEWPDDAVKTLCRRLGLVHCVDPFQRSSVWGEPAYYRLHGRGGASYRYSDADLEELKTRVGHGPAYVLFNNTAMWEDARRFRRLLG